MPGISVRAGGPTCGSILQTNATTETQTNVLFSTQGGAFTNGVRVLRFQFAPVAVGIVIRIGIRYSSDSGNPALADTTAAFGATNTAHFLYSVPSSGGDVEFLVDSKASRIAGFATKCNTASVPFVMTATVD